MPGTRKFLSRIANRAVLYFKRYLYLLARLIPFPSRGSRLLIVRLDAIGDYVLSRNCINFLVESSHFKKYQVTLLGNQLWKELAEGLDQKIIKKFIWINPTVLYNMNEYSVKRTFLLLKLRAKGYSVIIHPVHSRLMDIDEFISGIGARETIASSGDEINYQPGQKSIADKMYSRLVNVPDYTHFEFYRNIAFVKNLAGINEPSISLKFEGFDGVNDSVKTKIIISPGAGHIHRRWPAEKFALVMEQLGNEFPHAEFFLCGSRHDREISGRVLAEVKNIKVTDFCGKMDLMEFTRQVSDSSLVISNESSAVHIAAALDIPVICLSNGNMYGRFNPYPENLSKKVYTIYADKSFNNPGLQKINSEKTKVFSDIDISLITVDEVYSLCADVLKKTNIVKPV